ncbi:MAG: hypothetical protein WCS96_01170 [Victivallales bacterium]
MNITGVRILKHKFPVATLRRKDYITYLAVILFVMVIACEMLLVVWLPRKLHSEIMWQDQIAKEEMIELEDLLRAYMIDIKPRYREMAGEIELVQDSLNELARYLREHKDYMSRSQTDRISACLKGFQNAYASNIRPGKSFIADEKLDSKPYLDKLLLQSVPKSADEKKSGRN